MRVPKVAGLLALLLTPCFAHAQVGDYLFAGPPIDYFNAPVDNPISRLQKQLDDGEVKLQHDERLGYLPAILEALGIEVDSQALVFSKTSFQATRIGPKYPRALYFNDSVYVGYVKGGDVLEFSAVDPKQGAVFYLLDQQAEATPQFQRQTHECLQCHATSRTEDVPGHIVRSVFPDRNGRPVFNAGTFVTDHESPIEERWGGWYVTGDHGRMRHMGNVVVTNTRTPNNLDREAGANLQSLDAFFNTDDYPAPGSDIVALMVLEHQTQMHNRIAAAGMQARLALEYQKGINESMKLPETEIWDSTRSRIQSSANNLIEYMLFQDEATLTDPVSGSSDFAQSFAAQGPKDRQGRSLRDFDLNRRLFRYPCSYLIHSEAFDALPQISRDYIFERLCKILAGSDPLSEKIAPEDRTAIREILVDTKPEFARAWSASNGPRGTLNE